MASAGPVKGGVHEKLLFCLDLFKVEKCQTILITMTGPTWSLLLPTKNSESGHAPVNLPSPHCTGRATSTLLIVCPSIK